MLRGLFQLKIQFDTKVHYCCLVNLTHCTLYVWYIQQHTYIVMQWLTLVNPNQFDMVFDMVFPDPYLLSAILLQIIIYFINTFVLSSDCTVVGQSGFPRIDWMLLLKYISNVYRGFYIHNTYKELSLFSPHTVFFPPDGYGVRLCIWYRLFT